MQDISPSGKSEFREIINYKKSGWVDKVTIKGIKIGRLK